MTGFNQALIIGAGLYLIALLLITRPRASAQTEYVLERKVEQVSTVSGLT
jgi:hypothetical protein